MNGCTPIRMKTGGSGHAEAWNGEASLRLMIARFFAPDGHSE
jgi:hypothetical protein